MEGRNSVVCINAVGHLKVYPSNLKKLIHCWKKTLSISRLQGRIAIVMVSGRKQAIVRKRSHSIKFPYAN